VTDSELLERARQGDGQAFTVLFRSHQAAVYRYAAYMCGRDAADDIVQDTFLVVLRQRRRLDRIQGDVRSYLLGIARHCALKRLGRRETENLDDVAEMSVMVEWPRSLEKLEQQELTQQVRSAVESLPPHYREVVILCELEELDYADAAAVIGVPIGTIRSRLNRGRGLLVQMLITPTGERDQRHDIARRTP
jgi:RNA polymerase sigma-70 factor (ECF subfamily)